MKLRAMRRDRAARLGPELFLLERSFADCLERIDLIHRRFDRALLIGCPDASWRRRVEAAQVDVLDPGPLFAAAAEGKTIVEDAWVPEPGAYDLIIAVGTLDSVNDLPAALRRLRVAMSADALLIGAMSGGDTLPRLRAAMRAADAMAGIAAPHVHPRIEPSMLAPLLTSAGFSNPVVDVDRVRVSYRFLRALVADLRAMAATNMLASARDVCLTKPALEVAVRNFADSGNGEHTVETFEILHFAAWTPAKA
jgi:hypothetical protein